MLAEMANRLNTPVNQIEWKNDEKERMRILAKKIGIKKRSYKPLVAAAACVLCCTILYAGSPTVRAAINHTISDIMGNLQQNKGYQVDKLVDTDSAEDTNAVTDSGLGNNNEKEDQITFVKTYTGEHYKYYDIPLKLTVYVLKDAATDLETIGDNIEDYMDIISVPLQQTQNFTEKTITLKDSYRLKNGENVVNIKLTNELTGIALSFQNNQKSLKSLEAFTLYDVNGEVLSTDEMTTTDKNSFLVFQRNSIDLPDKYTLKIKTADGEKTVNIDFEKTRSNSF